MSFIFANIAIIPDLCKFISDFFMIYQEIDYLCSEDMHDEPITPISYETTQRKRKEILW